MKKLWEVRFLRAVNTPAQAIADRYDWDGAYVAVMFWFTVFALIAPVIGVWLNK